MIPGKVLAQDATPQVMSEPIKSLTREEFESQLVEELGYTEAATPGGIFIDSNTADIQTVHPFLAEEAGLDRGRRADLRNVSPAVTCARANQRPTGLADSWDIAPDGKTYTFHLNQNAKWHDGVAGDGRRRQVLL